MAGASFSAIPFPMKRGAALLSPSPDRRATMMSQEYARR
jgi:hypothetical protein